MYRLILLTHFFLFTALLCAQDGNPLITPDIKISSSGGAYRFSADLPELIPLPGAARKPFYTYFWEFGDGHWSEAPTPTHAYQNGAPREVRLYVTNNYAQGRTRPGRHILTPQFDPDAPAPEYGMEEQLRLINHQDPVPGDEVVIAVGYRNEAGPTLGGHLLLFYNETDQKYRQFKPAGLPRVHFLENDLSASTPRDELRSLFSLTPAALPDFQTSNENYRDFFLWRFSGLRPGEVRHLFQSFLPQSELMKDTNSLVTMTAYFLPDGFGVPIEKYTLEMTVRKSHDPNKMSVTPRLASFRNIEDRTYRYRVDFQNVGDGAASDVKIATDFPEGMDRSSLRILSFEPECPFCTETRTTACLDTLFEEDQLVFAFRGISLPGLNSEDIVRRRQSKGHVKYTLQPDDKIKKKTLKSRAAIYMDQNPPMHTNRVRSQFKLGTSLGVQAGYAYVPDLPSAEHAFLGITLTPYKARGIYPILGFNTGINTSRSGTDFQREATLQEDLFIDNEPVTTCYTNFDNDNDYEPSPCYSVVTDLTIDYEQTFFSFDLSAGARIDPFPWLTLGGGVQYTIQRIDRQETVTPNISEYEVEVGEIAYLFLLYEYEGDASNQEINTTRTFPGLFGELGLGQVQEGLSLGGRYVYSIDDKRPDYWQFFLQYRF